MNAPAYGLTDAPAALHRFLKRYLENEADSLKAADLPIEASKLDPRLFPVYCRSGLSVGVMTTHIGDLLGCGDLDITQGMEKFFSTRFGQVKVQEDNFAHIGMDVLQKDDGSVEITRKPFTDLLRPVATSPSLWRDGNRALGDEELQICPGKLGELRWPAAVSRPDVCARLARFSANLSGLKIADIYRVNDLIKTVKKWQSECALKYFAALPKPARRSLSCPDAEWGKPRPIHEDTMLLAGWSDAAFGTHAQDGRRRLGYTIGLMPSTLTGPIHISQWASKFTRKHLVGSLRGEIFAPSEMWGHMEMIREFCIALGHEKLGPHGLIDCESLLLHLRTGRLGTEKLLTRHFRIILDAMEDGDLGNVAWIPGNGNPADGLTKATSDRGPLPRLSETAIYRPGRVERLRGAASLEKA